MSAWNVPAPETPATVTAVVAALAQLKGTGQTYIVHCGELACRAFDHAERVVDILVRRIQALPYGDYRVPLFYVVDNLCQRASSGADARSHVYPSRFQEHIVDLLRPTIALCSVKYQGSLHRMVLGWKRRQTFDAYTLAALERLFVGCVSARASVSAAAASAAAAAHSAVDVAAECSTASALPALAPQDPRKRKHASDPVCTPADLQDKRQHIESIQPQTTAPPSVGMSGVTQQQMAAYIAGLVAKVKQCGQRMTDGPSPLPSQQSPPLWQPPTSLPAHSSMQQQSPIAPWTHHDHTSPGQMMMPTWHASVPMQPHVQSVPVSTSSASLPMATLVTFEDFFSVGVRGGNPLSALSGLSSLYGLPLRCKSCGLRLHTAADMTVHLESHAALHKRNLERAALAKQGKRTQTWYWEQDEWIHATDVIFGVQSRASSKLPSKNTTTRDSDQTMHDSLPSFIAIGPEDAPNTSCPMCTDTLREEWSDEAESWVYLDCVRPKASDTERVLHDIRCLEAVADRMTDDAATTPVTFITPTTTTTEQHTRARAEKESDRVSALERRKRMLKHMQMFQDQIVHRACYHGVLHNIESMNVGSASAASSNSR